VLTPPSGVSYTSFGLSVAISGNFIAIAAYPEPHTEPATATLVLGASTTPATILGGAATTSSGAAFSGATFVYAEPVVGWRSGTPTAALTSSDSGLAGGWNTNAVSISGNVVAVCAGQATYLYIEPSGGWSNMTETTKTEPASAVAISGNTLVLTTNAYNFTAAGAAKVYNLQGLGLPADNTPPAIGVPPVIATTITSKPATIATVGHDYSYAIKTNAGAAKVITYSLKTSPAGMHIGASTGQVTWTPAVSQLGLNSVTVVAMDQYGNATQQSFTINVLRAFTVNIPSVPTFPVITGTQPSVVSTLFASGLNDWWL
jgi:hypothetical protein